MLSTIASVMHLIIGALFVLSISSCTRSPQFKLQATNEGFSSGFDVTETKKETALVDILWVVDNSKSMDPSQDKLKAGIAAFAKRFLKPENDIQMAVTTSDAFLANRKWEKYLTTKITTDDKKAPVDRNARWNSRNATLKAGDVLKTKGLRSLDELIAKFQKQVIVGTNGFTEERGFDSVLQFLDDNEVSGSRSALFRKGSHRIIVFLTDEEEQSIDSNRDGKDLNDLDRLFYWQNYYTGKDQAKADEILPTHITIQCPAQTVDGTRIDPISACARPDQLLSTQKFKAQLDEFFRRLDGSADSANPNYGVVSIVTKTLATINNLKQAARDRVMSDAKKEADACQSGAKKCSKAYQDRQLMISKGEMTMEVVYQQCSRYIELSDQLGPDSFSMDIGSEDYSEILNRIGLQIEFHSKKFSAQTRYKLDRNPVEGEVMVVRWISQGREVLLKSKQYRITGRDLDLIDPEMISRMRGGDRIEITYQPATVLPADQVTKPE